MYKSELVLFLLFQNLFSFPVGETNAYISSTLPLKTTTKKSFVCPWYCYPLGIFSSLIVLILVTICISGCDYRYLKNHQELKTIEQKSLSAENESEGDEMSVTSGNSDKTLK